MPVRITSKRGSSAKPAATAASKAGDLLPFSLTAPPAGYQQKPPGISLCMIVKNEERFLAQCLQSVADVVDEIIIADTGSTDRTVEIARSFGATVIERPWRNDFSWARNQSLELATKRWIMFLDADEELTPDSKASVLKVKHALAYQDAMWVRCFNMSDDYRGTGAMSHTLIRIFPNHEDIRFRGLIHEFPTVNGSESGLKGVMTPISIVHHGYLKDVVLSRNKAQRNLDIVRASTEKDPTDPFNWFNLGATAFMMNDFVQARDALEKMWSINGRRQRGFIPNALAILAETYCDKFGDPIKGEEYARTCLELSPRYANAHFQLGKALVAQQRFAEAREAYEAAIADGAFAHLQFVIDDQVYIWKAQCEIGSSYVFEKDDESAVVWFRKAQENAPGIQPVLVNLARALDRLGQHEEAESVFRNSYREHRDGTTVVDFVNFLLRRGRGLDALEIIDASYAELPDEHAVAVLFAGAQISTKHGLPSTIKYLQLAVERAPWSSEVLNPLETALRDRGDDAEIARLRAAEAATEPRLPPDFLRRSYHAIERRDFAVAKDLAERGLALAPGDAHLHYNAALAASHLGEKDRALEHLAKVSPDEKDVFITSELLRAATEREMGRDADALCSTERLLDADPKHGDALTMRASIQEKMGAAADAEATLRLLLAADVRRGAIELASFLMRANRFEEAAQVADSALRSSV